MHPIHEAYVTQYPSPRNGKLANLWAGLDSIEELERDRMMETFFFFFDAANFFFGDEPTLEETAARHYKEFKDKCNSLVSAGMPEDFLVCGIVNYTLSWMLARCSKPIEEERGQLQKMLEHLTEHPNKYVAGLYESIEHELGQLQEQIVNLPGDRSFAKAYYELFCTNVVTKLLKQ